jgi:hypothetical protein
MSSRQTTNALLPETIAVVGVSSHGRDFGQEVLLEGAVGGLPTRGGWSFSCMTASSA